MFKPFILSFIFSFLLISTAFAMVFDPSNATSKQCEMIATTCKQAGYTQTVKSCRQFKIENMQQKINELKSVQ